VEIVLQAYATWEERDVARMTRDDDLWAAFVERATPSAWYVSPGDRGRYRSRRPGSVAAKRVRPTARQRGRDQTQPAHVVTLRDGRIIRAETWPDRAAALKAVGLEEE
jgi:hypothetical protein